MNTQIFKKAVRKRRLFFALILVVAALFIFSGVGNNSKESAVVERGDIREFLTAPGRVAAEKEVNLAFKTTGRVNYLPLGEGDTVEKGDVVAQLDTGEPYLSLGRAQDGLRETEATLARTYDDVKGHTEDESFSQRESRTQAEVARDKAIKSVQSAKKVLADASLYTPFDATVIEVNIELNEWVSAFSSAPHVRLADLSSLYFEAEVDQEDITKVIVGNKATVKLDAYPDREFEGEVYSVSKSVTIASGGDSVVRLKIVFSEENRGLLVGFEGDTQIILQEKENVVIVPKNAVYKKKGKDFVRAGGREKEVKLGVFDGVNWEIIEGLKEGERIKW
ncbi:MAG: efflux RND transporter periplasmic adaptor subunit [Patescibacteria group bacterium]